MKSFDNTVVLVLLELVAGVVFLLTIIVSSALLNDQAATLFSSALPVITKPASPVVPPRENPSFVALEALTKRVDTLIAKQKVSATPATIVVLPEQIKNLLNNRLQPIYSRFEDLNKSVESRLSDSNDPLMAKLQDLDGDVEALLQGRKKYISPMLGELNRKADSLLVGHETRVLPSLQRLDDKLDLLFREREQRVDSAKPPLESPGRSGATVTVSRVEIESIDLAPPEEGKFAKAETALPPVTPAQAGVDVLRLVQKSLAVQQVESNIDPEVGILTLPKFFDFGRGSATLKDKQAAKLAELATILAEILPCYTESSNSTSRAKCPYGQSSARVGVILIQSFSIGGNVGTLRINYNSRLANARSVHILRSMVVARPDLLEFFNSNGTPLFDAVGKLATIGDSRSRRTELQFIMEKSSGGINKTKIDGGSAG
jgi:hypothetical protein